MKKKILVTGAGGFIGSHLVKRLKKDGHHVVGVDLKYPDFSETDADEFIIGDLRVQSFCDDVFIRRFDEVYQLAADMGGAGYIFIGENDFNVMHNSSQINLNIAWQVCRQPKTKVFYSSSACIYPAHNQTDPLNPNCKEDSAYPAAPDSEYGFEKLFSERMFGALHRNFGVDIRIARFHNIFGEEGTYKDGKEKAPAAMCRKVAEAEDLSFIEVWGSGEQTRSFLYIDECIEGVLRLMESDYTEPVNIGSNEMVSINQLAEYVIGISGKRLKVKNVPTNALGVMGRNSDNELIQNVLGWSPSCRLIDGLKKTYAWIFEQVNGDK
jgi:GDP-D-mannose 3',5'-epimerase